jgi:hypothetical protein
LENLLVELLGLGIVASLMVIPGQLKSLCSRRHIEGLFVVSRRIDPQQDHLATGAQI